MEHEVDRWITVTARIENVGDLYLASRGSLRPDQVHRAHRFGREHPKDPVRHDLLEDQPAPDHLSRPVAPKVLGLL